MGLLFLTETTISMACFVISGLNTIFHWWAQFWIVVRSFSSKLCVTFTSDTLLNNEESSANNFISAEMLSGRSFNVY